MKNWFDSFNEIIAYIEDNLDGDIQYEVMGRMIGYSTYHIQRLFLMISNTPISEYIRNRRLSCAAYDLMDSTNSVTDIAYRYGYSSPTSFNRAFKAFHGVTPRDISKDKNIMKAYPPLRFELSIKGAVTMDYRLMTLSEFRVIGRKIHTTLENGQSYAEVPQFWKHLQQTQEIPDILGFMNQEPFGLLAVSDYNPSLDDKAFDYYIGTSSDKVKPEGYDEIIVPEATWAVFPCKMQSPEALQNFQKQIVMDWLPTSGYQFAFGPDLEVYAPDNTVEMWIPVTKM